MKSGILLKEHLLYFIIGDECSSVFFWLRKFMIECMAYLNQNLLSILLLFSSCLKPNVFFSRYSEVICKHIISSIHRIYRFKFQMMNHIYSDKCFSKKKNQFFCFSLITIVLIRYYDEFQNLIFFPLSCQV